MDKDKRIKVRVIAIDPHISNDRIEMHINNELERIQKKSKIVKVDYLAENDYNNILMNYKVLIYYEWKEDKHK